MTIKIRTVKDELENSNTLENHWLPHLNKINAGLKDIEKPKEKIRFLQDARHDYMQEVRSSSKLLDSSGYAMKITGFTQVGLDLWIDEEIKEIERIHNIEPNSVSLFKIKREASNSLSFINSQDNHDQLESIFNLLVKEGYLDKKVGLPKFKKVFNNKPLKNIKDRINWQGSSIASLRYFFKLFPKMTSNAMLFEIIAHCFEFENKKITRQQVETNKKPSKKDIKKLDNIKRHLPLLK